MVHLWKSIFQGEFIQRLHGFCWFIYYPVFFFGIFYLSGREAPSFSMIYTDCPPKAEKLLSASTWDLSPRRPKPKVLRRKWLKTQFSYKKRRAAKNCSLRKCVIGSCLKILEIEFPPLFVFAFRQEQGKGMIMCHISNNILRC